MSPLALSMALLAFQVLRPCLFPLNDKRRSLPCVKPFALAVSGARYVSLFFKCGLASDSCCVRTVDHGCLFARGRLCAQAPGLAHKCDWMASGVSAERNGVLFSIANEELCRNMIGDLETSLLDLDEDGQLIVSSQVTMVRSTHATSRSPSVKGAVECCSREP